MQNFTCTTCNKATVWPSATVTITLDRDVAERFFRGKITSDSLNIQAAFATALGEDMEGFEMQHAGDW